MFTKQKPIVPDDVTMLGSQKRSSVEEERPGSGTESPCSDKENLWTVLKKHWRGRGFVEIEPGHKHYFLTLCIRAGIQDFMKNHPRMDPEIILHEDDFRANLSRKVSVNDSKAFTFCIYAPAVFATLRRAIGIRERDYFSVIADPDVSFYEFLSNSLGKRTFFVTHDRAFFIKTETEHSLSVFKKMLKEYLIHFLRYPHSLLVKVVGLYSIQFSNSKKPVYFCVMQSIFHPDERLEARYDIKGCLAGRYTDPNKVGNHKIVTLKDKNFLEENFNLGQNKSWFVRQMELDVDFLCRQRVMDYSLLVGKHALSPSDMSNDAVDLFTRAARSLQPTEDNSSNHQNRILKEAVKKESKKGAKPSSRDRKRRQHKNKVRQSDLSSPVCSADDLLKMLNSSGGAECTKDNRRLLVNCKNSLHIVDGPQDRYFLGIVDFFTKYSVKQKIAAVLKSILYCGRDHSSVNPDTYSTRITQFFRDNTK